MSYMYIVKIIIHSLTNSKMMEIYSYSWLLDTNIKTLKHYQFVSTVTSYDYLPIFHHHYTTWFTKPSLALIGTFNGCHKSSIFFKYKDTVSPIGTDQQMVIGGVIDPTWMLQLVREPIEISKNFDKLASRSKHLNSVTIILRNK